MERYLNENQILAVKHNNGPMMVLAGPGSGKTTVITVRTMYLIEKYNVEPKDILVITFTKSAAEEMKERFNQITKNKYQVSFGTFHSFFYRVIRQDGYGEAKVLGEAGKKEALRTIIEKLNIVCEDIEEFMQNVSNEMSLIHSDMLDIEYYHSISTTDKDFRNIVEMYEEYKAYNNLLDFDDMISKCYELISHNPNILNRWRERYKYILVDEFQDINKIQYESIKLFAAPDNNLFIVGDDDQSIYKFRGARPEFLLKFPDEIENVKKIILNTNYRSTKKIIRLCEKVITKNKTRYNKNMVGVNREGKPPKILISEDVTQEAVTIAKKIKQFEGKLPLNEIAVIYRTNIQSRAFIDAFMDLNIPFQVKDEVPSIYEHFICRDICSYLRFAFDRNDSESLVRIINRPKRYINKTIIESAKKRDGNILNNMISSRDLKVWQLSRVEEMIFYLNAIEKRKPYDAYKYIRQAVGYDEHIKEYAESRKMTAKGLIEIINELQEGAKSYDTAEDYLSHIENAILEMRKKKNNTGVVLSTMHSAKGLEFEIVFVPSTLEGVIPHEKSRTPDALEEECRLFYVALTRAKRFIYISFTKKRYEQKVKPSRFLDNIY